MSKKNTVGDYEVVKNGALKYLVDENGNAVSEGYHEIHAKRKNAGPPGNMEYIGKRGASTNRISIIPKGVRE